MKLSIEIGSEIQRKQIASEFRIVEEICDDLGDKLPIYGIWVADNFDDTVNKLQGTRSYISKRGHQAVAKNIHIGDKTALVFSRDLYTNEHDILTRMQLIFHELYHAVNRYVFPEIKTDSPSMKLYLESFYILYDEYWVNRKSFEIVDSVWNEKSELYKKFINNNIIMFSEFINDTSDLYKQLKSEVYSFRKHGDISRFISGTREIFDSISKATIYIFAYIHHFTEFSYIFEKIENSHFWHSSAKLIGNFFKEKYEISDSNISDGINLIQAYFERFAIKLEDRHNHIFYSILDI